MNIPLEEKQGFHCQACGQCCSHIRGFIAPEDKEFIKEYAFGQLPIVQLAPVERMTFPLWDWEAARFRRWGAEVGLEGNIKPLRVILDLNTDKAIVVTYFMDSEEDACPFLDSEKKCSIYHTKRAYVCRLFPFNRGPFLQLQQDVPKESMFGSCGAMEPLLPLLPEKKEELIPTLKEMFPDGELQNAVQNDFIIEWVNRKVIELMRSKKIRPALNYPYDKFLKRVENAEKIDLMDFLVESGEMTSEEREELIARFDGNEDAVKLLKG